MDVRFDINGGKFLAVSLKRLSFRPNKELFKIPGDVSSGDGTPDEEPGVLDERVGVILGVGKFVFQIRKDRMGGCAVHITLLKDGEARLVAISWSDKLQRVQDLSITAVLLLKNKQEILYSMNMCIQQIMYF